MRACAVLVRRWWRFLVVRGFRCFGVRSALVWSLGIAVGFRGECICLGSSGVGLRFDRVGFLSALVAFRGGRCSVLGFHFVVVIL